MASLVMLGSGVQVAALRPFFGGMRHHGGSSLRAFMSVNKLGAIVGTPLVARLADVRESPRRLLIGLGVADAFLLLACMLAVKPGIVLALRVAQGAANVGALSLILVSVAASRRREGDGGATLGLAGSGVMLPVALGPTLGAASLRLGPTGPLFLGAVFALCVATLAALVPSGLDAGRATGDERAKGLTPLRALLRDSDFVAPVALAFVERFTVVCFVVTRALYASRVRHLGDGATALHDSAFLVSFAIATYPFAQARSPRERASLMSGGGAMYGASFFAFGLADGLGLVIALSLAGVASAMVYGASLGCLARVCEQDGGATPMVHFHAAGCAVMLIGPAVAGVVSAFLRASGVTDAARFTIVFGLAGAVQLAAVAILFPRLEALGREGSLAPRLEQAMQVFASAQGDHAHDD